MDKLVHAIHEVVRFEKVAPFTLRVFFEDGTSQVIDFWPALHGEIFEPLRDATYFDRVRLDPEVGTITWPNGADFDPATLHDWPQVRDELVGMARRWAQQTTGTQRTAW